MKENTNLLGKDLVDVLIPAKMKMGANTAQNDFVMSEHLTTVVLILAKGAEAEFQSIYESLDDKVVPSSLMKFQGFDDKEGNSLWRVVMFKSCVDAFKKACREKARGVTARDFEYSEEVYTKLVADREKAEEHEKRLKGQIRKLYEAAWSDAFCSWIHVKAMRVFVESVLRFGIGAGGPQFTSYILAPKAGAQAA